MNDYDKVSKLVLWERQARVRHLHDDLVACYWPDATVATSWISGPASKYLSAGNGDKERAEASPEEVITNRSCAPIVHMSAEGTRAYAELPTTSNHWVKLHEYDVVWTSQMRLLYRCEKRDGIWKIADLTSVFEMDKLNPVVPGTDLHINLADLDKFRKSYRWLSYLRTQDGGHVSNDLLGIDRPEDMKKLYDRENHWLATGEL